MSVETSPLNERFADLEVTAGRNDTPFNAGRFTIPLTERGTASGANRSDPSEGTGTGSNDSVATGRSASSIAACIRAARRHSHAAHALAVEIVDACRNDELGRKFVIGSDLLQQLDCMWKNRNGKDRNWAKLLNFLQSSLIDYVFEDMTEASAKELLFVTEMLCGAYLDNDDVRSGLSALNRAGLDPWRGLSLRPRA